MTTAFFTDTRFALHTQAGHPEHAGRLSAVIELFKTENVWESLHHISATPATNAQILAVHTQEYLDLLASTAAMPRGGNFGLDTYIVPQSYELARLAAGGVAGVVDAVMDGTAQNGIAAVRPPGHHATPSMGMGFCLLGNVAIAARHAIATHRIQRVAIVDYDVHHGNGTQDCLYQHPDVLFVSSHQSPLYPGTGMITEIGAGAGKGFTANIPLPPRTGDTGFKQVYAGFVATLLRRFAPQLILVSAGFDAHWVDPLANLGLSLAGYDFLARQMMALADELCAGRIVFVMEGGYDLQALSHGWLNIARALLGAEGISDPLGASPYDVPLDATFLARLHQLHAL